MTPLGRHVGIEIEFDGSDAEYHTAVVTIARLRKVGLARPDLLQVCTPTSRIGDSWGLPNLGCEDPECWSYPVHIVCETSPKLTVEVVIGGQDGATVTDALATAERVCTVLRETGVRTEGPYGLHVHVDRSDFGPGLAVARRLEAIVECCRADLEAIMGPRRRMVTRLFGFVPRQRSTAIEYPAEDAMLDVRKGWGEKMTALYWLPPPRHMRSGLVQRTIEWVGWESTTDPRRIALAVHVGVGLVQAAVDGQEPRARLGDALAPYVPDWLLEELAGPSAERRPGAVPA